MNNIKFKIRRKLPKLLFDDGSQGIFYIRNFAFSANEFGNYKYYIYSDNNWSFHSIVTRSSLNNWMERNNIDYKL